MMMCFFLSCAPSSLRSIRKTQSCIKGEKLSWRVSARREIEGTVALYKSLERSARGTKDVSYEDQSGSRATRSTSVCSRVARVCNDCEIYRDMETSVSLWVAASLYTVGILKKFVTAAQVKRSIQSIGCVILRKCACQSFSEAASPVRFTQIPGRIYQGQVKTHGEDNDSHTT